SMASTTAYFGPLKNGKPSWHVLDDGTDDVVVDLDLDAALAAGLTANDVMAYAVTYVEYCGGTPLEVELCVGSDDGVQVWFDTGLVPNYSPCRAPEPCQNFLPVTITPGVHGTDPTPDDLGCAAQTKGCAP